jgi:hypothetical protein
MFGKCPNHIKENISNRDVMWLDNRPTSIHMCMPTIHKRHRHVRHIVVSMQAFAQRKSLERGSCKMTILPLVESLSCTRVFTT